jgi:hypothetical protein
LSRGDKNELVKFCTFGGIKYLKNHTRCLGRGTTSLGVVVSWIVLWTLKLALGDKNELGKIYQKK